MTTTPAPTEIDTAVDVAARAIQAYQARNAFPPEQYTWDAIPQEWRDRHLAAARVMVDAAMLPVLDELAQRRQHEARIWQRIQAWNDDPTTRLEAFAITWERVEAAQGERDAARAELDGRVAWLYRNSTRMTQMRYDAATAAGYDFTQYAAQMDQPVDRDALIAYLREEITFAEREIAAIDANPATTAEPADEPKATCSCIVQPFLAPPRVVHLSTCEAKPAREQCEQVDCHNFGGLPEVCGTGPLFTDAEPAAG